MRTKSILIAALVASSLAASTLPLEAAQTKLSNAEAYRSAKQSATAIFLDKQRSDAERLRAATALGYPEDETMDALLVIGKDRSQSDAIRWEALRRVSFSDAWLDAVLKILDDPNDGGADLDANLIMDMTKRVTFKPPAAVRQRITNVLRKLLDDRRDRVRLYAFKALVANHDQVAVNLLADSLRRGNRFPIPLPAALDLIDQDSAASHIATLRPYLNHADPAVQSRAVRMLALDPQSRPAIVRLATSSETAHDVRVSALRGLAREDDKFPSYALAVVENSREDGDVRYAAMHAFIGRMNYEKVAAADQVRFALAVERIASELDLRSNRAAKIRSDARELHEYLKKAFPEIKKHYGIK